MDPTPDFTFHDLFNFVIGDMAKAVAERHGESEAQKFARTQAAVHMILDFRPRDVPEAFIAGHCVMLHEVMNVGVREILSHDPGQPRQGPHHNLVGLNKAFNDNLDRLEHYRMRPAEGSRDADPAPPPAAEVPTETAAVPAPAPQSPPAAPVSHGRQPSAPPLPNRDAGREAARSQLRAASAAPQAAPTHPAELCSTG